MYDSGIPLCKSDREKHERWCCSSYLGAPASRPCQEMRNLLSRQTTAGSSKRQPLAHCARGPFRDLDYFFVTPASRLCRETRNLQFRCDFIVTPARIERATYSLEGCCSIQLSYGAKFLLQIILQPSPANSRLKDGGTHKTCCGGILKMAAAHCVRRPFWKRLLLPARTTDVGRAGIQLPATQHSG